MKSKQNIALIGISLFFLLLFNAPFITIPEGITNRVPSIALYLGIVWIMIILLMIIFASKNRTD